MPDVYGAGESHYAKKWSAIVATPNFFSTIGYYATPTPP
jgi:hypothetical protein